MVEDANKGFSDADLERALKGLVKHKVRFLTRELTTRGGLTPVEKAKQKVVEEKIKAINDLLAERAQKRFDGSQKP